MSPRLMGRLAATMLLGVNSMNPAQAQDDPPPASTHCVSLLRIDHTETADGA